MERNRLDETRWRRVADWVGRLPLALTILNGSLRERALSAHELAELAEGHHTDPLEALEQQVDALRPLVPEGELVGIAEALQISYDRLTPDAQRGARLLGQLGPQPVPLAVLIAFGENVFSPAVRAMLAARSFVAEATSTQVEAFGGVHQLLGAFLRGVSSESDAEARQACEALAAVLSWEACKDPIQWPLLDACRPHAERALRLSLNRSPHRYSEPLITLGANLGYLLRMEGHFKESAEVRGQVLKLATGMLGDKDPRTLKMMEGLAAVLRRQGELGRSRDLAEQVLESSIRLLGIEHLDTLTAMATLAATLRDQGELNRSRDFAERVYTMRSQRLGLEHLDTLVAMGNLAATLRRLGQLEQAERLEERVLEARCRLQGDEHWESLIAMANLATTRRVRGDLKTAQDLQERVLKVRTRLFGDGHDYTLRAMANLAVTLRAKGELRRAAELEERVPPERRTWQDD
jgi:tetratricopeptide (TPR) repeat protein